jgi:hypothetical protein
MFREFVYIDYDYTVRIQDGYIIFRWWRVSFLNRFRTPMRKNTNLNGNVLGTILTSSHRKILFISGT